MQLPLGRSCYRSRDSVLWLYQCKHVFVVGAMCVHLHSWWSPRKYTTTRSHIGFVEHSWILVDLSFLETAQFLSESKAVGVAGVYGLSRFMLAWGF